MLSRLFKHKFKNWSRTIKFWPNQFKQPTSTKAVINIVNEAREKGWCIRPQGAGHSFSPLLPTHDTLLKLDKLESQVNVEGTEATVPAGMKLKDVIKELKRHNLGLKNIGSITEQSIAGAISTGTHGTGRGLGSMSTLVKGMTLVSGNGEVRVIKSSDNELLRAARLSLGAMGIITEVTLECVPYYSLEYSAYLGRFDSIVNRLDDLSKENERVLLWWLLPPIGPHDLVIIITKNSSSRPQGFLEGANDVDVMKLLDRVRYNRLPMNLVKLARMFSARGDLGSDECWRVLSWSGGYEDVLTIPLLPVYHQECEYAIPAENAAEALRALRVVLDEADMHLLLPVEVRYVAKDDSLLSPSREGDVCYIGASTMENALEVFNRFEPMMRKLGGRPHWGKHFNLNRDDVRELYPETFDTFVNIRREWDPERVFLNSFLRNLFE